MQKKIPMRQCVGCREMRPKRELVRVVKSPEGEITLDFKGKAPRRICLPERGLPEKGPQGQGARTRLRLPDPAGGL